MSLVKSAFFFASVFILTAGWASATYKLADTEARIVDGNGYSYSLLKELSPENEGTFLAFTERQRQTFLRKRRTVLEGSLWALKHGKLFFGAGAVVKSGVTRIA